MKEKDKYYIPELEDIRVGYEYFATWLDVPPIENSEYQLLIFKTDSPQSLQGLSEMILQKRIYTAYLTREQIEKEGWTTSCDDYSYFIIVKQWLQAEIVYNYKTLILKVFINKYNTKTKTKSKYQAFEGKCKSINEFRILCKYLEIE